MICLIHKKAYIRKHEDERNSVYNKGVLVYNFNLNKNKYSVLHGGIKQEVKNNDNKSVIGALMNDGIYTYDTDYIIEKVKYAYVLAGTTDTKILLPIARMYLYHFLDCTGTDEVLDVKSLVNDNIIAGKWYRTNTGKLSQHIEDTLKVNHSMTYVTEYGLTATYAALESDDTYIEKVGEALSVMHDYGIFGAMGQSVAAMTARSFYDGDYYYTVYRYIVYDYYDWNFEKTNAFVLSLRDCDMFAIGCCGFGKPFYIYGEM